MPFQAADIVAYIMFLQDKFINRKSVDWGDKQNIRWMFEEVQGMFGHADIITAQGLTALEGLLKVCSIDLLAQSEFTDRGQDQISVS